MQTVTAREFNQYTSRIKKLLANGPVMVSERGEPSIVLLSWAEYQLLITDHPKLSELLSRTPGIGDVDLDEDLDPTSMRNDWQSRSVDLE